MSLFSLSTWSIYLDGWVKGIILKVFLLLALYCWSTPSCLKVVGGWRRRLYTLRRRLYTFEEEVIHPEEEVITLL